MFLWRGDIKGLRHIEPEESEGNVPILTIHSFTRNFPTSFLTVATIIKISYRDVPKTHSSEAVALVCDGSNCRLVIGGYAEQSAALQPAEEFAHRTASYFGQRLQGGMIGYLDVVEAQRTPVAS